jgi:hypothetical protein
VRPLEAQRRGRRGLARRGRRGRPNPRHSVRGTRDRDPLTSWNV